MPGVAERVLNLFFPNDIACFACDKPADTDELGLCHECAKKARRATGLPLPEHIDGITAGLFYDEFLHKAMHRFKYSNGRYLASNFAGLIELNNSLGADIIAPVPLYPAKQKERGYNQCALIARAVSERYGLPFDENLLLRIRDTQTQTHLNRSERAQNVYGAFRANGDVRSLSIIIIDDVTTTGSTLSACAAALKSAGAKAVYAACACAAGNDVYGHRR